MKIYSFQELNENYFMKNAKSWEEKKTWIIVVKNFNI